MHAESIPHGYCRCGCGERTKPATNSSNGNVKGEPQRYLFGHRARLTTPEYAVEDRGYVTPCWIWLRHVTPSTGYGHAAADGIKTTAHRMMYERLIGAVPAGLDLDHLCRVRACCNPEHLEPVTHTENVRRGRKTKLTAEIVREIRVACGAGERYSSIAARFGISQGYVSQIWTRRTWADA